MTSFIIAEVGPMMNEVTFFYFNTSFNFRLANLAWLLATLSTSLCSQLSACPLTSTNSAR